MEIFHCHCLPACCPTLSPKFHTTAPPFSQRNRNKAAKFFAHCQLADSSQGVCWSSWRSRGVHIYKRKPPGARRSGRQSPCPLPENPIACRLDWMLGHKRHPPYRRDVQRSSGAVSVQYQHSDLTALTACCRASLSLEVPARAHETETIGTRKGLP